MKDKLDSYTISKQLQQVENEKYELSKKKNLWEEYQNHWYYLQRKEQELLGEIASLSLQTVSAKHAEQELDFFEEDKRMQARFFNDIHEYFESKFEVIFDTNYRIAHDKTLQSGRPWDSFKELE